MLSLRRPQRLWVFDDGSKNRLQSTKASEQRSGNRCTPVSYVRSPTICGVVTKHQVPILFVRDNPNPMPSSFLSPINQYGKFQTIAF